MVRNALSVPKKKEDGFFIFESLKSPKHINNTKIVGQKLTQTHNDFQKVEIFKPNAEQVT